MLEQYFFLYKFIYKAQKKADVCHVKHLKDEVFDIVNLCNSMKLMNARRPSEIAPFTSVPENSDFAKKNMHAVDAVSGPKILIVDNRLQNCGIEQNKLCVCPFHLLVIFEYDEISDLLVKNSPMHGLRGDLLTWFDMRQFKSNTLCNLHDLITKQNLKFSGKEEYFIVRLKYASHN
ncbi:hypothetical protein T09_9939 [Trichinella sp. T9]|nr:hypothetical protein T09_9939 [Trichinella sp. T9]